MKTVAKILIMNSDNEILVLRRSDTHPHFPLHLDFPGGLVDPGETPEQTVIRELKEETGLTIAHKAITKIMEKKNNDTMHLLYEGAINTKTPNVKISWEHCSYEWVDKNKLLQIEHPEGVDKYYKDVISHLQSYQK